MTTRIEEIAEDIIAGARRHGLKAPQQIAFGIGVLDELGALVQTMTPGEPAALITGNLKSLGGQLLERVSRMLGEAGATSCTCFQVTHEPTNTLVDQIAEGARAQNAKLVIGLGGGSAMDTAKAVSALLTNEGAVEDYLEGVGRGLTVDHDPAPMIAVPATAATGAEMTKNAVIANYDKQYKKSMRDERMIPHAALVDPALTYTVPRAQTAAGGMDAVTQLIEPCISTKRTPATTALALKALPLCLNALPSCCETPDDPEARTAMSLASMTSGICLANSGLALVHGIASGMGAVVNQRHGLICGVLLPHTLRYNRQACEPELRDALAAFLNRGPSDDVIDIGIAAIEAMNARIGVPPDFKHLELSDEQVRVIAEKSQGSSMKGNPIPMDVDSTYAFLQPLF